MHSPTRHLAGIFSALVVASVGVAGCGGNDTDDGGDKPVNVAFLTYTYNDYTQAQELGIKNTLKDNGGKVQTFNSNFDPNTQHKQCQDVVTSGRYSAIVLATVLPATGVPCAKIAKAAGIPVATIEQSVGMDPARLYDTKPQVDGVVASNVLVLDTQVKGYVGLVEDACGDADPCKIIYELSAPGDPFSKAIIDGIKEQVPQVDVVQEFAANFDPAKVAKAMPDILAAHRDVNVFVSVADSSALAALPAIKSAGMQNQLKVIGNGGSRAGAKAVAAGALVGTIGIWPQQTGAFAARALIEAVKGQKVTEPAGDAYRIDTPLEVTKDTVDNYAPEWGAR